VLSENTNRQPCLMVAECSADAFGCRHLLPSLSPSPATMTQPDGVRISAHVCVSVNQSAIEVSSLTVRSRGGGAGVSGLVMSCSSHGGIGCGVPHWSHVYGCPVSGCGDGGRIVYRWLWCRMSMPEVHELLPALWPTPCLFAQSLSGLMLVGPLGARNQWCAPPSPLPLKCVRPALIGW
jgi:hypothetical protein